MRSKRRLESNDKVNSLGVGNGYTTLPLILQNNLCRAIWAGLYAHEKRMRFWMLEGPIRGSPFLATLVVIMDERLHPRK